MKNIIFFSLFLLTTFAQAGEEHIYYRGDKGISLLKGGGVYFGLHEVGSKTINQISCVTTYSGENGSNVITGYVSVVRRYAAGFPGLEDAVNTIYTFKGSSDAEKYQNCLIFANLLINSKENSPVKLISNEDNVLTEAL